MADQLELGLILLIEHHALAPKVLSNHHLLPQLVPHGPLECLHLYLQFPNELLLLYHDQLIRLLRARLFPPQRLHLYRPLVHRSVRQRQLLGQRVQLLNLGLVLGLLIREAELEVLYAGAELQDLAAARGDLLLFDLEFANPHLADFAFAL